MGKCTICLKEYENTEEVNGSFYCPQCRSLNLHNQSASQASILEATDNNDVTSERNLLQATTDNGQLQASSTERDSQMTQKVQDLTRQCQKNSAKLIEAQLECAELKKKLKSEIQEKIMILEQKNTLEEKLKQLQLELQKEIRHSTELSMDKMRLEVLVERTSASRDVPENKYIKQHLAGKKNSEVVVNAAASNTAQLRNGMIIKGFQQSVSPWETVLKLGQQMQLCFGKGDIEEAVLQRRHNNISLVVGLKTKTLRDLFLSNAEKLKYYPETRHLEFCPYSTATDLLGYAKRLKSVGFNIFYVKQNCVFARLDHKSMPIKILNKETVDRMMESSTNTIMGAPKPNEASAQLSAAVLKEKPGDFETCRDRSNSPTLAELNRRLADAGLLMSDIDSDDVSD